MCGIMIVQGDAAMLGLDGEEILLMGSATKRFKLDPAAEKINASEVNVVTVNSINDSVPKVDKRNYNNNR